MSVFNQTSFGGGMNLFVDGTRLQPDQYRAAFNVRSRTDTLIPVLQSQEDTTAPVGLKQEMVTFGNYIILFVAGNAYYRYYTSTGWQQIVGFRMSPTAPRYWTETIPVSITNYRRNATTGAQANGGVDLISVASASQGNVSGLLVQDNVNQPLFIYLSGGFIQVRTTQSYAEWSVVWGGGYTVADDKREYVPIGNAMKWDGVRLWIASQDGEYLYRSVSGRPLDFVINVDNVGQRGGDANTTNYSVGVGGITTLKTLADGSLFVGAGNANFTVAPNMTPGATTLWGEPTFIRTFLFNATCLSDRVILDSNGDTRFIDLTGVRSFNAILQTKNEGRNSAFTSTIKAALDTVRQSSSAAAAILYNNDELYAVNTIFGPAIAVYDSLDQQWSSFDINQTGGVLIKQFAKIELSVQRLYAITVDDKVYELYSSTERETGYLQTLDVNAAMLQPTNVQPQPNLLKHEIKPLDFRCIMNEITQDMTVSLSVFCNNRLQISNQTKAVTFAAASPAYNGPLDIPSLDTQLNNLYWTFPNCGQGWKSSFILSWTGGAVLTQFSAEFKDLSPMNPALSQGNSI